MTQSIASARAAYAEKIRGLVGLRSESLLRSLASVPREDFLGPGPWKTLVPAEIGRGYRDTPDADPRHLYENVLVAIDPARQLNNGEPAGLLRWLDSLELRAGDRFLHVGCGVGYYTAVAAGAVRPGGRATGVEVDPGLAARARANTAKLGDVEILPADGSAFGGRSYDAIFVNAGATDVLPVWLDSLADGGRMLLPLTVPMSGFNGGIGWMLLVQRDGDDYAARFHSPVGIYHCTGARSEAGEQQLQRFFSAGPPAAGERRLRRDRHERDASCGLHGERFCLTHVR